MYCMKASLLTKSGAKNRRRQHKRNSLRPKNYLLSTMHAIGERERVEEELRRSEALISKTVIESALEKSLLHLHAAMDTKSLWKAIQGVIDEVMPSSLMGLTLQHNPILPMIALWTKPLPNDSFNYRPIEAYLDAYPRSKLVRASDVFPTRSRLLKSDFYRQYMVPHACRYAVGLFFWSSPRLMCVITIMRSARQRDFSEMEMKLLLHLHPQFQTALHRLGSLEHEHSARLAFEGFLERLPLPTILLRWNLKLAYQNQAAREFSALWESGPDLARAQKANAPIPVPILNGCRMLKQQWEKSSRLNRPHPAVEQQMIHHPKWPYLRATLSLKQLGSAGVVRPHFLIECEELRHHGEIQLERQTARLPHLVRLTRRQQEVTRLTCEGRSNQEIADEAALSLAMVKKHLHSIFRKLEVNSRSQLMALMH